MGHIDFDSLQNSEIRLETPNMERVEELHEVVRNSQLRLKEFLPWAREVISLQKTELNLQQAIENFSSMSHELRFSIIDRQSDQLLGLISLKIVDPLVPFFEIGYWLGNCAVGRGIMSQSVKLVEHFAIDILKAKRIEIVTAASNRRSRAVAERCGYHQDALFRHHRRLPSGAMDDTVVYSKCPHDEKPSHKETYWSAMVPELLVSDFEKSLHFYTEALGFSIRYQRQNPDFVYLEQGALQIMLEAEHGQAQKTGELSSPLERGINLQMELESIQTLSERLHQLQIPLYRELQNHWYDLGGRVSGERELLVQDPDGYLLRFSEHLGERSKVN
ncbi:MAG: hypothetical protein CENE_03118 [Candidatus Celerinatantimonas neptuna]|nr:MAG: hypothetical protein CENE_03118 [Candidatus Celerinatantimonas neptuna]